MRSSDAHAHLCSPVHTSPVESGVCGVSLAWEYLCPEGPQNINGGKSGYEAMSWTGVCDTPRPSFAAGGLSQRPCSHSEHVPTKASRFLSRSIRLRLSFTLGRLSSFRGKVKSVSLRQTCVFALETTLFPLLQRSLGY